jgi:hypothetical protein
MREAVRELTTKDTKEKERGSLTAECTENAEYLINGA